MGADLSGRAQQKVDWRQGRGPFLLSLVIATAGYLILVGSAWAWAASQKVAPPLWPVALSGALITLVLLSLWGGRGLLWSLVVGSGPPLLIWLFAVAEALLREGGASDESKFAIWAGLGMGVGIVVAAWLVGAVPGSAAGQILRTALRLRQRTGRLKDS